MIRHKYTSTATGTGSPITIAVPTGYSNSTTQINEPGRDSAFPYVIEDADGIAWEYGYGKISGTSFTRSAVLASTNANNAVSLSAGTHLVYVPDAPSGRVAQAIFTESVSVTASATHTVQWDTLYSNIDGAYDLPGATAPTLPLTLIDLAAAVPYARGYQVTYCAENSTAQTGELHIWVGADENNLSYLPYGNAISTARSGGRVSVHTPILECPVYIPGQGWAGGYPNTDGLYFYAYNTHATTAISVDFTLHVDYFL